MFVTRSGISYNFDWLCPLDIYSNCVFLANYGIYIKLNSNNGFFGSKNMEKVVLHLILVVKLADVRDFHATMAAIFDCSQSGHQGDTQLVCDVFQKTLHPYLSSCQIKKNKTCNLVHDSTFTFVNGIFHPCYWTHYGGELHLVSVNSLYPLGIYWGLFKQTNRKFNAISINMFRKWSPKNCTINFIL